MICNTPILCSVNHVILNELHKSLYKGFSAIHIGVHITLHIYLMHPSYSVE